jgi:hypothetical protein
MNDEFTRTYELGRSLGIELGKHQERERIIKILKDYAPHLTTTGLMDMINEEDK